MGIIRRGQERYQNYIRAKMEKGLHVRLDNIRLDGIYFSVKGSVFHETRKIEGLFLLFDNGETQIKYPLAFDLDFSSCLEVKIKKTTKVQLLVLFKRWSKVFDLQIFSGNVYFGDVEMEITETDYVLDPLHMHIDFLELKDTKFMIRGWIFHEKEVIKTARIVFDSGFVLEEISLVPHQHREDVKRVFPQENAYASGFFWKGKLRISGDTQVLLLVEIEGKQREFPLCVLSANISGDFHTILINEAAENIFRAVQRYFVNPVLFKENQEETIDIVVPVYNGYDYLVKLLPGIAKTKMKYQVFLVDDASPDEKVKEKIKEFSLSQSNVTVLTNEENLGFVRTVNRALALCNNHVVLLNTDVELPERWLERLLAPILYNEKIASATPYTNSGTIFSFPDFLEDNPIYLGKSVDEIDAVFRQFKPGYTVVPTGVGFCMAMSKHALKEVGGFDDETFSKGYGEENDWCQRAKKAGYQNVHVENLFVYHKHGGSFTSQEKLALIQENMKKLEVKHPDYTRAVERYILNDPNSLQRSLAKLLLDTKYDVANVILVFNHHWAGGASSYLDEKINAGMDQNEKYFVVRTRKEEVEKDIEETVAGFELQFCSSDERITYVFEQLEELLCIMEYFPIDAIWVNELVTYPNISETLAVIMALHQSKGSSLKLMVHDFFSVCPTIDLLGQADTYCNLPSGSECDDCYMSYGFQERHNLPTVGQWRDMWKALLLVCDEILVFSEDSKKRMEQVFGTLRSLSLQPHKPKRIEAIAKQWFHGDGVTIGLLGALGRHKGKAVVQEMLDIIHAEERNVRIVLIGYTDAVDWEEKYGAHVHITGPYLQNQLSQYVIENEIDIIFIPAIWPETFSYTTEEAMMMDIPVVSFPIGAPPERIVQYEKGMVLPNMNPRMALDAILAFVKGFELK
ncbi:MAG: glycosyltransferase [Lachnospiraceae bacterium]|nr:glycosyltransferase [Lachnospiraceae bacterium]